MPASFHSFSPSLPTKGKTWTTLESTHARITHMSKKIDITGGTKLSDLFTIYGKVVNGSKRRLVLAFDIYSSLKTVKAGVQVNAEDKASALASLSDAERAAVAKYEKACKANAAARDTGELVDRWTITGTATTDIAG